MTFYSLEIKLGIQTARDSKFKFSGYGFGPPILQDDWALSERESAIYQKYYVEKVARYSKPTFLARYA